MNENNNLSVLPWYDNIDGQNSRKSYAYGNIYPLFTPAHSLLPFQILRKPNEVFNPNVKLYTKDGVFVLDITEQMVLTGLQLAKPENTDKMEVIVYPAYFPLQEKIPIGMYYAVLNDGVNTWYSDIFTIINDSGNYLSIEWYDDDTLYCDAGIIVYRNPTFRNRVYFCTEIGKPDYTFEEEGEERDGYFFPIKQLSEKVYRFNILAPEYLCDVMRLIRLSDHISIRDSFGRLYKCDTFLFTPKWETQGDLASVEIEFQTNTVVKKLGSVFRGDFNNDFNNDFNIKPNENEFNNL